MTRKDIGTIEHRNRQFRRVREFVESKHPLRAMVLEYRPELTHSVWVDAFISDEDGFSLSREELIEKLKQGVRDGEWVAWRLIRIEQEVMGNVD